MTTFRFQWTSVEDVHWNRNVVTDSVINRIKCTERSMSRCGIAGAKKLELDFSYIITVSLQT